MFSELPPTVVDTRLALHQLAVHVLARRRHAYTERFGLRPSPGGMATPAFGDDIEAVRTSGRILVVERAGAATNRPITTLAAAAELVGVDLGVEFSVGDDTPTMVDADLPLAVDQAAASALGDWWTFGTALIDEVVGTDEAVTAASALQLWPEHFDVGATVTVCGDGGTDAGWKLNVGASPGDGSEPQPYLYVGPWAGERPGDGDYWNAPFGAVLRHADLAALPPADQRPRALAFLAEGVTRFAALPAPPLARSRASRSS